MRRNLATWLRSIGFAPPEVFRARRAAKLLKELESGPAAGDRFLGPQRKASDRQLAPLAPAIRAVMGIGPGGIRIIPSTQRLPSEDDPSRTMWPEGEATAGAELLYLLRRAYPDKEVHVTGLTDLDDSPGWQQCNLVFLGGPRASELVRTVWGNLGQPYLVEHRRLLAADGRLLHTYQRGPSAVSDAAVMVRGDSPFSPGRVLVVFMGLETHGTCAAAACLASQDWLRLTAPRARRLRSLKTAWAVSCGINDPWPAEGHFLAPIEELRGGADGAYTAPGEPTPELP